MASDIPHQAGARFRLTQLALKKIFNCFFWIKILLLIYYQQKSGVKRFFRYILDPKVTVNLSIYTNQVLDLLTFDSLTTSGVNKSGTFLQENVKSLKNQSHNHKIAKYMGQKIAVCTGAIAKTEYKRIFLFYRPPRPGKKINSLHT